MSRKLLATQRAAYSYVQLSRFFAQDPFRWAPQATRLDKFAFASLRFASTGKDKRNNTVSSPSEPLSAYKTLIASTTALKKRPTRDELLAVTHGFLERLRIRFKWFTIRGFRPYRTDDWSAFFSWIVGGVSIWVVLGTTSFMASVFFLLNSLQMQEWLAAKLGAYMTDSTGITVRFESAIVPRFSWGDSKLTFTNVTVARGHPDQKSDTAAVDAGADAADRPNETSLTRFKRRASALVKASRQEVPDDYASLTRFHLSIDEIDVSLSLSRWLDGKGLVKDAFFKGVRGVVDRSHIVYDPDAPVDRMAFRHTARPGDFHLEGLQIEDFLVTIFQPNNFRPYTCSIFSATIPTLRKQWLFLDLMSADSITGQVDNCLFSLHRPQSLSSSFRTEDASDLKSTSKWAKMSRFRIDGFSIDHLQSPHDQGALAWITSGKCDLVADIRFPRTAEEEGFEAIIGRIADSIDQQVLQGPKLVAGLKELSVGKPLQAPEPFVSTRTRLGLDPGKEGQEEEPVVSIDLTLRFKDIKATIPIFTPDLSYVNNALVRPIVAFLNANRTLIPINCRVDLPMSEFDGSWTTYDTGILSAMSVQVYKALEHHIQNANERRAKQVGIWSLQLTARGVIRALQSWNESMML